ADQHFAAAAFGVLGGFLPHAGPRVLELPRCLAVLAEIVFGFFLALRELPFELFDVRGLQRRLRRRLGIALAVLAPAAAIDDLHRNLVVFVVSHGRLRYGFAAAASNSNVNCSESCPIVTLPPCSSLPNRIS